MADGEQSAGALQGLCLDCGMCCDGTLFECVELEPSEQQAFVSVTLIRVGDKVAVPLPCSKHRDKRCTVYEQRPIRCKKFTCKLYEGVAAGSLSYHSAQTRIADAQRLFAVIEGLLGWEVGGFSTTRFRTWAAGYDGGEAAARKAFPEAFLKYGLLRLLMERHFIPAPAG
jgi:hypothetical protein